MPGFNVKGQTSVNTVPGGLLTGIIMTITLTFAGFKMSKLINKDNPVMSELTIQNFYGPEDKLYFNDMNFRVAFSVEGYWDETSKTDTAYVKWMARHWHTNEEGEIT